MSDYRRLFEAYGRHLYRDEYGPYEHNWHIETVLRPFPTMEAALDYCETHELDFRRKPVNAPQTLRKLCDLLADMGFRLEQDETVKDADWEGFRLIDPDGEAHEIDAYTFFDMGVCGL